MTNLDPATVQELLGWCWVVFVVGLGLTAVGVAGIIASRRRPQPAPADPQEPVPFARGLVKVGER